MGVGWRETSPRPAFVPIHGAQALRMSIPLWFCLLRGYFQMLVPLPLQRSGDGVRVVGKGLCSQQGLSPPLGNVSRPVGKAYFYSASRNILH